MERTAALQARFCSLAQPKTLHAQVERMLDDPRGKRFIDLAFDRNNNYPCLTDQPTPRGVLVF